MGGETLLTVFWCPRVCFPWSTSSDLVPNLWIRRVGQVKSMRYIVHPF